MPSAITPRAKDFGRCWPSPRRTPLATIKGFASTLLAAHVPWDATALVQNLLDMLEIGRALMWEPKLVLMDEPSAGLVPPITRTVFENIQRLNEEIGLTVLMIEQNARQGLRISHRGYVLELGRKSYEGAGEELLNNEEVRRAFPGG